MSKNDTTNTVTPQRHISRRYSLPSSFSLKTTVGDFSIASDSSVPSSSGR
ncbi:MAG: hypothetical protein HUK12_07885 [Muribaculaceae bacterium]|nr:hypothetical protein [Muribaculaceae bacterium]